MGLLQSYQPIDAPGLSIFVVLVAALVYFMWRAHLDVSMPLRPISAFESLKDLFAGAAEAGKPVHISIGTAGAGAPATVDTAAGL